ncbi:poly [ADP-ribose] polymerase tankyrase-1-like [Triticum dicoccoides]|uniref:poly [ADP-ribose] polymerase tankyrase-1-like n=1 Tax=Triticum dicoccoides TaxID=85692 RepID=UPI00188E1A56|nr:poly [ADP-ribose] polymerase tankyrase-1-like [Triticum dicoccoides]
MRRPTSPRRSAQLPHLLRRPRPALAASPPASSPPCDALAGGALVPSQPTSAAMVPAALPPHSRAARPRGGYGQPPQRPRPFPSFPRRPWIHGGTPASRCVLERGGRRAASSQRGQAPWPAEEHRGAARLLGSALSPTTIASDETPGNGIEPSHVRSHRHVPCRSVGSLMQYPTSSSLGRAVRRGPLIFRLRPVQPPPKIWCESGVFWCSTTCRG